MKKKLIVIGVLGMFLMTTFLAIPALSKTVETVNTGSTGPYIDVEEIYFEKTGKHELTVKARWTNTGDEPGKVTVSIVCVRLILGGLLIWEKGYWNPDVILPPGSGIYEKKLTLIGSWVVKAGMGWDGGSCYNETEVDFPLFNPVNQQSNNQASSQQSSNPVLFQISQRLLNTR